LSVDSYKDSLAYRAAVLTGRAQGLADATNMIKRLSGPLLRAQDAMATTPDADRPAVICGIHAELAQVLAEINRQIAVAHHEITNEAAMLAAEVQVQKNSRLQTQGD
jgi:hypothetical protein